MDLEGGIVLAILEFLPDAVILIDEEGRLVYLNPAAERLWSCPREEACGKEMASLLVPESHREHFQKTFPALVAGGRREILGKRHRFPSVKKDGAVFMAEVAISQLEYGGRRYYLGVSRDVTDQHRLEDSLREARERYRVLHDNAGFAIFSYDRFLRLTSMNRVVSELLGYEEEELLGKNVLELGVLHPEDVPLAAEAMGQLFAGNRVTRANLRFIRKDGSTLIANAIGVPIIDERGEVVEIMNIAQDITERRRLQDELERHRRELEGLVEERTRELNTALEELHHSERYFRALIENTHDLIAVLDEDLRIRYLSPSVERISGYSPEEAVGKSGLDFIHPEDVPSLVERFTAQLESSGVTERAEYRWKHKDSSYRWQEAVACNLLDDPAVRGIVINARDITDRREAEQALLESEERYRSLVETSPDAIVVTDLEGRVIMANPAAARLTGCPAPQDMVGRNVLEFIALEDHARAIQSMRTPTEGDGVRREEYVLVRADGRRRWVEISASLLRDARGKPVGFMSSTRDITEHKQAELAMERLNQSLLSLGHDPLVNIPRIVLAGQEILGARMARYGRKEHGRFQVFSSQQAEAGFFPVENFTDYLCYRLMEESLETPVSRKDMDPEVFLNDPDVKAHRMVETLSYPVKLKGAPVGCLCYFYDEEKNFTAVEVDILIMLGRAIAIEEDRRDYQEGLRDFVDIASHELRHPTAIVSGFAQLLTEREGELDEATRAEIVQSVLDATDRLTEITDGLVRASLLERDRLGIVRRREDMVPLVRSAVSEMEFRFPEREFTLNVKGEIGTCSVDPIRVHELLVILLDNAVKFSPPGTAVEVEMESAVEGITVSVLDRGRGVEAEDRERIFERFYQAEKSLYHSEGLGLGLFLARRIAEAHGGRIWHEPRPGGGSVFRFFLPYL